uniref:ANK_REP_REGION domain-containing protein n=1 Tax=Rodentolepis nana TaxID=102285 RepID=A0A0R3T389_RODNA
LYVMQNSLINLKQESCYLYCTSRRNEVLAFLSIVNLNRLECFKTAGLTPLHVAAFIGSAELVGVLLERGASVEQTTMRGETPLHLGARSCRPEVAELLLTHGASVDAKAKVRFNENISTSVLIQN